MNTGLLTVIAMSTFGVFKNINQSNIDPTVRKVTAMTESSLRKAWVKCIEAEEVNRMFQKLLAEGVGTDKIECASRNKEGREKWRNRGEEGRKQVVQDEVRTRIMDSTCKVRDLKVERSKATNKFKKEVSNNIFRRKMAKLLEFCKIKREAVRCVHDKKVAWMRTKYGRVRDDFCVPEEVNEYKECKVFKCDPVMKPEAPSGPVIVSLEDEDVDLNSDEWSLLARGPKYCVVRGCSEEDMRVEIETCVLKHKWDCMGREGDEDDELLSDEEKLEHERVAQLAEEMAAQTRMVHNTDKDSWDARGLRVTDYKHNSRVIFPKAGTGEQENNLEVLRTELLHHHREWVKQNCNCKNEQKMNLSKEEQSGLKSLKKRVAEGSLVVLPTDKSGRLAVMTMDTYIKAGKVHIKDDEEIGLEERKANQKVINGTVSMLLKIFRVGCDSRHEARWRESMISKSLEACPLWLLFKDHKLWESSRGTPPPTRPVMGGNSGMNTHLSEILSWLLEPLATSLIGRSSEVISGEDLKNKMDALNDKNKNWKPAEPVVEPVGESSLMERALEAAPGLCGCEECTNNAGVQQSPMTINASWQCQEESSQEHEACQESESRQPANQQQESSQAEGLVGGEMMKASTEGVG